MGTVRRAYECTDEWLRGLSRVPYAFVIGACAAVGMFVVGSLLGEEFVVGQAITIGVVMFALECVFGKFQSEE